MRDCAIIYVRIYLAGEGGNTPISERRFGLIGAIGDNLCDFLRKTGGGKLQAAMRKWVPCVRKNLSV